MEWELLIKLLVKYADLAAVPIIVALVSLIKKTKVNFLDWGKLNFLHPLWMATGWYLIRKFGVLMPIELTWPLVVLGIIATSVLAVGLHSSGKNAKQQIAKWIANKR